jgi:hypothetical protein
MHTLVRTYTFLKYAEHQIASAKELAENRQYVEAAKQGKAATVSVYKAVVSAVSGQEDNIHTPDHKKFTTILKDLVGDVQHAKDIGKIFEDTITVPDNCNVSEEVTMEIITKVCCLVEKICDIFPDRDIIKR